MAIRVALHHRTEYRYDRLVTLLPQVVRLRPAPHCRTPILSYSLRIEPGGHFLNWQQDPYSNYLARLVFPKPATHFKVEVDLVAEMATINPFDFFLEPTATNHPFSYDPGLARDLTPFLETGENGPRLLALVASLRPQRGGTIDCLVAINRRIQEAIRYGIRLDPGIQTCEETLSKQAGSCRDSAWLLVQLLRHLGLAARFVSGYLIQLTADEKSLDGPSGPEKDFTDLHAWAEVFLPGAGWIGLDPTSGLLAGEGHIPLACTANPTDAAPVTGSFQWDAEGDAKEDKAQSDFCYDMSVTRIHEDPRVTRPYSDEQWRAIFELGTAIDDELETHDVRLTMGGEPTFVAIDDKDAAEWNTAALGPTKRKLADTLLRRLQARFAPGAFLHHGQGKWYPGESLPRWSFSCYWRKDGLPIWHDPALFARDDAEYRFRPDDAARFMTGLARRLQVDAGYAQPAYEDAWYYLWRERRLPGNVDPLKSNLDDQEERLRLARVFDRGLGTVVGYALPLKHADDAPGWLSGRWFLRREHLFLSPGDSPMGYRLPLDSLPWEAPAERDTLHEPDPFRTLGDLPGSSRALHRAARHDPVMQTKAPSPGKSMSREAPVIRTALCIEPRQGRMHVFMPPLREAEEYLELIQAIETTAADLRMPVQIEGYLPPFDPRLLHFRITPDPGVIEVNIHPAANWRELTEQTTILYEEARQTRLCTEKFMLDGRHTGTGGGNHIVLGGPTPADSPMLRRPDLLRSLLGYWHNHPSLSYLFSSLFVGPTSQAPRLDEARNDSLYEMEIAFEQLGKSQDRQAAPPWLVDRIFRHLLVDVSGNTHRAEFCIDKLYSPDSAGGRLGLVEFRAFEMPPHSRMSLVQQLLMRALVMRFWKHPYSQRLARWGTELHDRYLLPHFVHQDFRDVLCELRQEGLPFRDEWFAPHFEFRFPLIGSIARQGTVLELRTAMEPWHVLGEENTAGGTARYVDSSVERLQVKIQGMTDSRHTLACNGRPVPLFPTGVNGEFVAGVRYKAWQPPSCLHPTIAAHSPLVFDVYDTWMRRAVAGCTYHVAHPGGRSHETFPVNANEAEGRRIARFFALGHTPGTYPLAEGSIRPEAPLTLDLRHAEQSKPEGKALEGPQEPARGRRVSRSANVV
jgi:uncharacterized protein (DUF2126 family)/transglutaminase-like putative cysteine protease